MALRARIVLACAAGGSNVAVAARLGVDYKTVSRWRSRFLLKRLDGLTDDLRPGVPRIITDAQVRDRLRQRVRCFTGCYPAVSVARSKRWL
ncbi:MAG: helix-turn-helix domain-containing protein [Trebonia sp.]